MLEVVNHLRDEEREDFRLRIESILSKPALPLPRINSEAWVEERDYTKRDYKKIKKSFFKKRKASIKWLKKLHHMNWNNAYIHPRYGAMSARMFLVNWLAHDYVHIRQLIKLKYDYLNSNSKENMKYAG